MNAPRDNKWMDGLIRDLQRALYNAATEAAWINDPRAADLRKMALKADDLMKMETK